ncbi:hypothetical protein [Roseibacillus persicicus]
MGKLYQPGHEKSDLDNGSLSGIVTKMARSRSSLQRSHCWASKVQVLP